MKESEHQKLLMEWSEWAKGKYPELELLFHIPNGMMTKIEIAQQFKAMGLKAGVPDLFLPVARKNYHGLFIEMKSLKGRVQDNQKYWHDQLERQGYKVTVCYGFKEAKNILIYYLEER